jgi:hypothetical protein
MYGSAPTCFANDVYLCSLKDRSLFGIDLSLILYIINQTGKEVYHSRYLDAKNFNTNPA